LIAPEELPNISSFKRIAQFTVIVFDDFAEEPLATQLKIVPFFRSGKYDGISSIYIAQHFYETYPNIHTNLKYISLHCGCGTLDSIKRILKDIHDDYESLAKKIYEEIKKHFVVIDIRRPANDPLSIRYRWDKPLLKTVTYKKLSTHTRKFLRSDATRLSPEAIEEIRNAQNNISNAQRIMCKKHHIGAITYQKIIDNQRPPELTEEWRRILDSVSISDRILENNKESLQPAKGESSPIVNTFKDNTSAIEVALLCNRKKAELEKLIGDTERLAPIYLSLPQ
ncbi:1439_t:CDS:2, partial [Gigaspora margarita]